MRRSPSALIWGVYPVILDLAALLYSATLIWIMLSFSRQWAIWDAQLPDASSGDSGDVWNDFLPVTVFLVLLWSICVTAASLLWIRILWTSPARPQREGRHRDPTLPRLGHGVPSSLP